MRSSRVIQILAGVVVLLLLCNALLSWALIPSKDSSSDVMWYGYQNAEEIDSVFVGSSLVSKSLDPTTYDALTGAHSYNMGTNAQMFAQAYTAIDTAWREHHIKTAILGIGYFQFQMRQGIGNEVAFYQARNNYSSLAERIVNDWRYITAEENWEGAVSVNYFFPWVYDHVTVDAASIVQNIQDKAKVEWSDLGESGNGFSNEIQEALDFSTLSYNQTMQGASQKETNAAYEELAQICTYCKDRGIDLYVVNMPMPQYYVVAFPEDYFDRASRIRRTCEENGVAYYDFNVARPELFTCKDEYYVDYEHVNQKGAEVLTSAIARLVTASQAGEDTSGWFYDQDSYQSSIDRIVCTNYTYTWDESGGLRVDAKAYCGSAVEPEYQFSLVHPESGEVTLLQEYSASSSLYLSAQTLQGLQNGKTMTIRVEARDRNHTDGIIRYYEELVDK